MESALYGARLMNVFERSSPLVAMSAVSDLVNGWPGGIIQASRHGLFVSPLYHVNQMYSCPPRRRTVANGNHRSDVRQHIRRPQVCRFSTPWCRAPRIDGRSFSSS